MKKEQNAFSKAGKSIASMPTPKKVYASMWAFTGVAMFTLIGLFVGMKDSSQKALPGSWSVVKEEFAAKDFKNYAQPRTVLDQDEQKEYDKIVADPKQGQTVADHFKTEALKYTKIVSTDKRFDTTSDVDTLTVDFKGAAVGTLPATLKEAKNVDDALKIYKITSDDPAVIQTTSTANPISTLFPIGTKPENALKDAAGNYILVPVDGTKYKIKADKSGVEQVMKKNDKKVDVVVTDDNNRVIANSWVDYTFKDFKKGDLLPEAARQQNGIAALGGVFVIGLTTSIFTTAGVEFAAARKKKENSPAQSEKKLTAKAVVKATSKGGK